MRNTFRTHFVSLRPHFGFTSLLILFSLIYLSGCNRLGGKASREGVIEYAIAYPPETMQDNVLASMMPSKMTVKFKNNMSLSEIKFGMGIMDACFISNPEKKILITLLQIVDKKYALVSDSTSINEQLRKSPAVDVTFLDEIKTIAGYKCKKAVVKDNTNTTYDVFYTNDLKLKESNWYLPLNKIGGVLFEYNIRQNNMLMKLTATSVTDEKIDDTAFTIPKDYKVVTKQEMPEIFSQFFQ